MFEAEHFSLDEQRTNAMERGGRFCVEKSLPENLDVTWMEFLSSVSGPE